MSPGLRVEWAKSLAHAERWEEEVLLLREEMRRTLVVLDHQAVWWRKQGTLKQDCESVLASGLRGYAEKQASIRESLAMDFAAMWLVGIQDSKLVLPVTWPEKYLQVQAIMKKVKPRLQRNKLCMHVVNYVKDTNIVPSLPISSVSFE